METRRAPGRILVRPMRFELGRDQSPHWNPRHPELSQVVNGASLLLSHVESYLVDSVRQATRNVNDPDLLAEVKAWMRQETMHQKQHRLFNDWLIENGYESVRAVERTLAGDYARLRSTRSLKFHLAYAVGFETLALAIAHMAIDLREDFFGDADPTVTSLVLWHLVEQIEHKSTVFEVYEAIYGDWSHRVYGLVWATLHTLARARQAYRALLRADGRWGSLRTRWEMKKLLYRIFRYLTPEVVASLRPGYHPSAVPDPVWAREWQQLYDAGVIGLDRLDTSELAKSPASMFAGRDEGRLSP